MLKALAVKEVKLLQESAGKQKLYDRELLDSPDDKAALAKYKPAVKDKARPMRKRKAEEVKTIGE